MASLWIKTAKIMYEKSEPDKIKKMLEVCGKADSEVIRKAVSPTGATSAVGAASAR